MRYDIQAKNLLLEKNCFNCSKSYNIWLVGEKKPLPCKIHNDRHDAFSYCCDRFRQAVDTKMMMRKFSLNME